MKLIQSILSGLRMILPLGMILFFPFFILVILGGFYLPDYYSYQREVIAFGLLTSILFVLAVAFKNVKARKYLICFFSVILAFLILIKLSFYYQYGAKINASALYVIFETNGSEVSDFLKDFINWYVIALFFVLLLPLLFILRVVLFLDILDESIANTPSYYFKNRFIKVVVLMLSMLSSYLVYSRFQYENILLETYNSYQDYAAFKNHLNNTLAQKESKDISVLPSLNEEQTYVVVIGESTSRWHMQLYGYNRETSPLLTQFKNELYVFKDVISPHTHTILSLEKTLTLSDYHNPNKKANASIVQLANQAGFTTFWLSNQRPFGLHESIPTQIGNAANYKYFINSEDYIYDVYDEKLLPHLDKILSKKTSKKMIFIHLMGTHNNYERRYPEEFDYFTGVNSVTKFKHEKSKEQVNNYDNAVRYNDSIVRTIIDKVKNKDTNSYVVYFSDHGEELYDTMNLLGHNEYHGTKPMYDVPFVVWLSEKYKLKHPFFNDKSEIVNRSYNLEDFIHSFSDISDINFDKYDVSKSIFSNEYKKKKRLIKNNVDYDKR